MGCNKSRHRYGESDDSSSGQSSDHEQGANGNKTYQRIYVLVKAIINSDQIFVFGLPIAQEHALIKKFSGTKEKTRIKLRGKLFELLNSLENMGYVIFFRTGNAEVIWMLQKDISLRDDPAGSKPEYYFCMGVGSLYGRNSIVYGLTPQERKYILSNIRGSRKVSEDSTFVKAYLLEPVGILGEFSYKVVACSGLTELCLILSKDFMQHSMGPERLLPRLYYAITKVSVKTKICSIFGLPDQEEKAILLRFTATKILNGLMIKASTNEVTSFFKQYGFVFLCSSTVIETTWIFARGLKEQQSYKRQYPDSSLEAEDTRIDMTNKHHVRGRRFTSTTKGKEDKRTKKRSLIGLSRSASYTNERLLKAQLSLSMTSLMKRSLSSSKSREFEDLQSTSSGFQPLTSIMSKEMQESFSKDLQNAPMEENTQTRRLCPLQNYRRSRVSINPKVEILERISRQYSNETCALQKYRRPAASNNPRTVVLEKVSFPRKDSPIIVTWYPCEQPNMPQKSFSTPNDSNQPRSNMSGSIIPGRASGSKKRTQPRESSSSPI